MRLFISFTPPREPEIWQPETIAGFDLAGIPFDTTIYYGSTAQEITGEGLWNATNALIVAFKDACGLTLFQNNLSDVFNTLFLRVGGTGSRHAINWATGTSGTYNGGFTHDATGSDPNGTNGYFQTGVNWNQTNFPQNSHAFFVDIKEGGSGTFADFGTLSGGQADVLMYGRTGAGALTTRCGGATGNNAVVNTTAQTFKLMSRESSTQYKVYEDGSLLATITDNSAVNSTNYELVEFALNSAGTIIQYSPRKHGVFGSCKRGITSTEQMDIYNAVVNFNTALNR